MATVAEEFRRHWTEYTEVLRCIRLAREYQRGTYHKLMIIAALEDS
jgi:hypothetical protein